MDSQQLQRYLQRTIARRVSITLDDDQRELVKAEPRRSGPLELRLHGSFLDASTQIIRALARFLRRPEPHLRRRVERLYRRAGLHRVGNGEGKRHVVLRHKGEFFDLKEIYDELNERFFEGRLRAFVTWGRRTSASRRVRSIHFGSYNWARRVIRVHPDLDREYVPLFFLRSVLYHEMVHVDLGIAAGREGRRLAHTPEFQRRERAWPDYDRAKEWERAHLHYFLRGAPGGVRGGGGRRGASRRRHSENRAARRSGR